MVECNHERMVLSINQGCSRGYNFTLRQKNKETGEITPINLSNSEVLVQVKVSPYYVLPSLIEKHITADSDVNTVGSITSNVNGQFTLQITKEESLKLEPGEYALLITLIQGDIVANISGEGNNNAIFRVCHQ